MARVFICPECKGKFKHHEFVHHRRKTLVFKGWDDDLNEQWEWHRCGDGAPLANVVIKKRNDVSKKVLRIVNKPKKKAKTPWRSHRLPGPRKITTPKRDKQVWGKKPRAAYCTGCGFTFTHRHLLLNHHSTDKCGGRFLSSAERKHLFKLRREREALLRFDRHLDKMSKLGG